MPKYKVGNEPGIKTGLKEHELAKAEDTIQTTSDASKLALNNFIQKNGNLLKEIILPKAPRLPTRQFPTYHGAYPKNFAQNNGLLAITDNMLRVIAKRSGLLSAILARRDYQFNRVAKLYKIEGDTGFKVVHEREHDKDFNVPEQLKELCRMLEQKIARPWPEPTRLIEPTFSTFCSKWIKSTLIINRPAIELGLDSKRIPQNFSLIDGANIYPTFEILKDYVKTNLKQDDTGLKRNSAYYREILQKFAEDQKISIDESTEYLYIADGIVQAGYKYDELLLFQMMPSDDYLDIGYPPSCVEKSLNYIAGEIAAMSYTMKYFDMGAMIDTILAFQGNYTDEEIEIFKSVIQQNHSGINGAHTLPLLNMRPNTEIKPIQVKDTMQDMRFTQWLIQTTSGVCNIFGMPPEEINFASNARTDSAGLFQGDKGKQVEMNREEGFLACCNHLKQTLDFIIKRHHPDLCFEWQGIDNSAEDRRRRKLQEDKEILTVRERRVKAGYEPVAQNMKDEDVDMIENNVWLQSKQLQMQKEMAKKQQAEAQKVQQEEEISDNEFKQYLQKKGLSNE